MKVWIRKIMMIILIFCITVGTFGMEGTRAMAAGPRFWIEYLDVGQADAAIVYCGGHYMMIDGGDPGDSRLIYSYLKSNKIDHLDYMIATHPDDDHIGGLSGALQVVTVDHAYSPVTEGNTRAFASFIRYLSAQEKKPEVPDAGSVFRMGGARITILGPTKENNTDQTENNNRSIVVKISYGKTSFLFTGDAEREEEESILELGADLKCDVLKVGHHGSASSTSDSFLQAVSPAYAVISCGKENAYGHPMQGTLDHLSEAGAEIYRTDLQGDIYCSSDGNKITFRTEKKNVSKDEILTAPKTKEKTEKSAEKNTEKGTRTVPAVTDPAGEQSQNVTRTGNRGTAEEMKKGDVVIPAGTTYVLNTNTHKFHDPDCNSVTQMKAKNASFFTGSREEVPAEYVPCGNCKP